MDKKLKKSIAEFLRYLIVGFSNTALNWLATIFFTEVVPLSATAATILAWIISTIFYAFWAYKFFVFRSKSLKLELLGTEFVGFTSARLFTLGVEALIMFTFCDLIGFDDTLNIALTREATGAGFSFGIGERYIVKLFACVIITILNYIFSKVIIFKKGQRLTEAKEEVKELED